MYKGNDLLFNKCSSLSYDKNFITIQKVMTKYENVYIIIYNESLLD